MGKEQSYNASAGTDEADHVAKLVITRPFDGPFDYTIPEDMTLSPGDVVSAPFGRGEAVGIVWAIGAADDPSMALKPITRRYGGPPIREPLRRLVDWMAAYTLQPRGLIAKMIVPVKDALEPPKRPLEDVPAPQLRLAALDAQQQQAADALVACVKARQFAVTVLDGVTGSGKTEVYFAAIAEALSQGRQVAVLLPEIALSIQWLARFEERFGFAPTLWHSHLTPAKRRDHLRAIMEGKARLVVGARSALMLPYPDLGLIVVDEEHDPSFKQEEQVVYHGRDMAVARARFEQVPAILVSATPSLETVANMQSGKYQSVHLPSRHGAASMPSTQLVDMRSENLKATEWISGALSTAVGETLESGEQAMLFLNRRGYAPLTLCRHCGHRLDCPHCSTYLVYHAAPKPRLQCHHCGFGMPMLPACPECEDEEHLATCGPGVERIAELCRARFPSAKIGVMSSDVIHTAKQAEALIDAMHHGEINLLVGTQMIAKGHHFPDVTLVGILDADFGLGGTDLRAGERTFQLLHQVSGRAGRGEKPGRVLIQSYMPEHPALQAIAAGDRDRFYQLELKLREQTGMPPFGKLAAIILSGKQEAPLQRFARQLASQFPQSENLRLLGPAPAPIYRLRGQFRIRLLVKATKETSLQPILRHWLAQTLPPKGINSRVDIDPVNFM